LQRKLIIEATDIVAFHFECETCHWSASFRVDKFLKTAETGSETTPTATLELAFPDSCPNGCARLSPDRPSGSMKAAGNALLQKLRSASDTRLRLSLEVKEPVRNVILGEPWASTSEDV
jgi:hypothetical protein